MLQIGGDISSFINDANRSLYDPNGEVLAPERTNAGAILAWLLDLQRNIIIIESEDLCVTNVRQLSPKFLQRKFKELLSVSVGEQGRLFGNIISNCFLPKVAANKVMARQQFIHAHTQDLFGVSECLFHYIFPMQTCFCKINSINGRVTKVQPCVEQGVSKIYLSNTIKGIKWQLTADKTVTLDMPYSKIDEQLELIFDGTTKGFCLKKITIHDDWLLESYIKGVFFQSSIDFRLFNLLFIIFKTIETCQKLKLKYNQAIIAAVGRLVTAVNHRQILIRDYTLSAFYNQLLSEKLVGQSSIVDFLPSTGSLYKAIFNMWLDQIKATETGKIESFSREELINITANCGCQLQGS